MPILPPGPVRRSTPRTARAAPVKSARPSRPHFDGMSRARSRDGASQRRGRGHPVDLARRATRALTGQRGTHRARPHPRTRTRLVLAWDTFALHPGPAPGPAYRPSTAPQNHRGEGGRAVRAIHPSIAPSSGLLIATSNDPSAASASLPSV